MGRVATVAVRPEQSFENRHSDIRSLGPEAAQTDSLVAIANLFVMGISRIGFAMARDGVLPTALAQTSTSGTPRVSLTLGVLVASGFAVSGTYQQLLAVSVPLTVATIAALDLAAIVMSRREPDLPRPFKMPWFPMPAIAGLALNLVLLAAMLIDDPLHSLIGIGGAIVLGIGYALLGRGKSGAPPA